MKKIKAHTPQICLAAGILSLIPILSSNQSATAANLLLNGGFEEPAITDGTLQLFDAIPGWTSITPNTLLEVQRNVAGAPFEGEQFLELDSYDLNVNPGDVLGAFQDVPTEAGQTYRLSFYFSPRPNRPATDNEFQVSFGNVFNLDFEAGAGGSETDWQRFSTLVTANSDLTRLQFAYTGNLNTFGSYIDGVRLERETVPEPATLLGLTTVLGLGTLLKQPRSRGSKKS